ncbi:MAG TPA: hypothetical protein VMU20_07290 [Candidatus Dormibacteraeota bacterium]|nr:hypothetical protein [Candidatus Dormibacteraeota bacterium]
MTAREPHRTIRADRPHGDIDRQPAFPCNGSRKFVLAVGVREAICPFCHATVTVEARRRPLEAGFLRVHRPGVSSTV